jgi:uncharacterized protein (TIGR03083 family)
MDSSNHVTGWCVGTVASRTAVDYVTLFAEERACLLALLAGLTEDQWGLGTPCPGWSVLDLAAHLLGNDLGVVARQRDHHSGVTAPDPGDEAAFAVWLDRMQDDWVRACRRLSPRLVVELLSWTGALVVDLFQQQDPAEVAASVSWASDQPVPRWLDHARELTDCWIHRQQLLEALGRAPDLDAPTTGAVLDALRWAYPYRLRSLARPVGDTAEIIVRGPVSRHWFLQSQGTSWSFEEAPRDHMCARLETTTDSAWRLLSNNLSPEDQAVLHVTGDRAVTDVLLRTRAIIGTPNAG